MAFDPNNSPFYWSVDGAVKGARMYGSALSTSQISANYQGWTAGGSTTTSTSSVVLAADSAGLSFTLTSNTANGGIDNTQSVTQSGASGTGQSVSSLVAANFSDAADTVIGGTSANTLAGIAIVAYTENSAKGAWQYSTDAGTTWAVISTVSSATSAITLTASDLLRFAPKPDFNGAVPVLTFVAIENSTTVVSGAVVDASVRGGSTSFSSASLTISQSVTAVVDIVADSLSVNEDSSVTANLITGTNGANADNFENSDRVITAVTQGHMAQLLSTLMAR